MAERCVRCEVDEIYAKDRCEPCYRHLLRKGYDRPITLLIAHGRRGRRSDMGTRRKAEDRVSGRG